MTETLILKDRNCIARGSGEGLCLLMEVCGIGDNIHSAPTICDLVKRGIEVTIYARGFVRSFWEKTGARFIEVRREDDLPVAYNVNRYPGIPEREMMGIGFIDRHLDAYRKIIALDSWSCWETSQLGYSRMGMMELFADIIEEELPEHFSWIDFLQPKKEQESYIIFSPESTEVWRTIPPKKANQIYRGLCEYGKVIWLSQYGSDKMICQTFEDLINIIYNAKLVVSVENGTLNIAAALGVTVIGIHSISEPGHTIERFRKYLDVQAFHIYGTDPQNGICKMPCYRTNERGMINDKCCGIYRKPYCLIHLDANAILSQAQIVMN